MSKAVRRKSPNDVMRGADFNELLEMLISERIATVGPGISVSRGAAGVAINVDAALRKQRAYGSTITDTSKTEQQWIFGRIKSASIFRALSPQSTNPLDPTDHIYVWAYTFEQVKRNGMLDPYPYPNGWYAVSGGIIGTCYNLVEMGNPGYENVVDRSTTPPTSTPVYGKGVHGNGVDTEGSIAATSMTVQACPVGTIVILYPTTVKLISGTTTEYYFQYENGVDGACT